MSSLLLPRRFYNQPQGAVSVDWSNPLANGLQMLLTTASGSVVDIVNPNQVWTNNNPTVIVPATTKHGIGQSHPAGRTASRWSSVGYTNMGGSYGTYFIYMPEVLAASAYGHVTFAAPVATYCQVSNNNSTIFSFGASVTLSELGINDNYYGGKDVSLVHAARSGAAGSFLNGIGSLKSASPAAVPTGSKTMYLGGYTDSGYNFNGNIMLAGYTTITWGAAEAKSFHDNPWQIFKVRE